MVRWCDKPILIILNTSKFFRSGSLSSGSKKSTFMRDSARTTICLGRYYGGVKRGGFQIVSNKRVSALCVLVLCYDAGV